MALGVSACVFAVALMGIFLLVVRLARIRHAKNDALNERCRAVSTL